MKLTFDIEAELYKVLSSDTALTGYITGKVYTGERPVGSNKEDVTINTPSLSQDFEPQRGYSNVNIHIPDLKVKIGGADQMKADRTRLRTAGTLATAALKSATIPGLALVVMSQTVIAEPEVSQHFVNLRIEWSIH
jgi:hypothetical protein